MKRLIALPAFLAILLAYSFQCRHDDGDINNGTLKGKLIVNGPCGYYAIQLLEGNIDPAKITPKWKNPANDGVYTNAFAVRNVCTFGGNKLVQGDIFTFQLDIPGPVQNCMQCMIAVPLPPVSNAVKNVQKLK